MVRTPSLLIPFLVAVLATSLALLIPFASSAESTPTFDHFTTGFDLQGAHRLVDCEGCHVNAVFEGSPIECSGCHTQASRIRATWQPPTHLTVTQRCEACHRPAAWVPVARVDHLEVQGNCSSCHNNITVRGQHPEHIPTTSECDSCHNTRFWR